MPGPSKRLFEVTPREQVGAQTGKLFEYQYHQAAAAALRLLDAGENAVCVYCEWHDDYVTEGQANGLYTFYQVKTQGLGAWTVGEFFGLGKLNSKSGERSLSTRKSCIFSNLWDHTLKFGGLCQGFVFLSDAAATPELQALVDESKHVESSQQLSKTALDLFSSILPALARREPTVNANSLLSFLQRLHIEIGIGAVESVDDAKLIIVDRIVNASEVKLEWSEAKRMGNDLVTIVRARSHKVLPQLPSCTEDLRSFKGLTIADVLRLLSLSEDGFRLLSEGAADAVKTLSRLHRYCRRRQISEALIPQFCELKTRWSAWWLRHAELIDRLDFAVFKNDCLEILRTHTAQGATMTALGDQAKALAAKYTPVFNPMEPLTAECVMGYFIALAVEAER